jgi:hypothetical protein
MKRKIIKSIAFLLLAVVAYGFLGPYGVHTEECIKCGAMRIQLRTNTVPLMSYARETPVSAWYRTFDAHHTDHAWGAVSGNEHTWSNGWPGWSSYDNFGLTTAFVLRDYHERRDSIPVEVMKRIMEEFMSTDIEGLIGDYARSMVGAEHVYLDEVSVPSFNPYEFDLLRDAAHVSSVDLVLLKGWPDQDYLGGIITQKFFAVGNVRVEVDRVISDIPDWRPREFLQLFEKHEPKQYEPCFCTSKYPAAFVFYVDVQKDHFGEDTPTPVKKKVAVALFDESHDSILMTDLLNATRGFRFSVGHSETNRVPEFIGKILSDQQIEYRFLDR